MLDKESITHHDHVDEEELCDCPWQANVHQVMIILKRISICAIIKLQILQFPTLMITAPSH